MSTRCSTLVLSMIVLIILSGCATSQPSLPTGEQTLRGVLTPVEFSLARRGTYQFTMQDGTAYYAESQTLNLAGHEGHQVTVKGTLEQNTDTSDTLVLIISAISDPQVSLVVTPLSSFGLQMAVPSNWVLKTAQGAASFTASGASIPALSVFTQSSKTLPFDWKHPSPASGIAPLPFPLLGRSALLLTDESSGTFTAFVAASDTSDDRILTFLFSRVGMLGISDATAMVQDVLQKVEPLGASSSSAHSKGVPSGASGTGAATIGQPCGGTAGILCPSGSYCAITDRVNNVGRCQRLSSP